MTGVEFLRVQGVQGLRGEGVLQGVRAMAARVYAGEDWYVQDDGGTGRVECLYEKARRGRGVVKFVIARLTAEDRWASDGRRAARADVEQGGLTTRDAGGAAPERATVDGEGGSAGAGADDKGVGGDSRGAGLQGCRVEGEGGAEMGSGGGESGVDGGGGVGSEGGAGVGDDTGGEGGGERGGGGEVWGAVRRWTLHGGESGGGPGEGEGAGEEDGAAAAGDVEGRVGREERAGRGEKRRREGREADRVEGRQVRTRTGRRGGRKRKTGDG